MLETIAYITLVVLAICLILLWLIIHALIILVPILFLAGCGYGLFFLGTMAYGSRRAKDEDDAGGNDPGGL